MTPDEWDVLAESNKAQMMAFEEASATMAAYEDQQNEEEAERKRNKPKPKK